jgi:hypothetical protein
MGCRRLQGAGRRRAGGNLRVCTKTKKDGISKNGICRGGRKIWCFCFSAGKGGTVGIVCKMWKNSRTDKELPGTSIGVLFCIACERRQLKMRRDIFEARVD